VGDASFAPGRTAKPFFKTKETAVKVTRKLWTLSVLGGVAAIALTGTAWSQQTLKIGVLASLEGPFAVPGQDSMRGADLALMEKKGMAGGKKIEFIKVSSDATPDKAVASTRKAVEQDKVQIMIGPLSGDEGIAVKNYAKTQPGITFVNGSSGAQATTLVDPAPNFFRFNTEGAQWMVGLGEHALSKGYKKTFLVAEDYGFPYSQVQGFMASYCAKGGKVVDKAWVPLGTKDYASVIARIPSDIDAVVVVLGGSDAVNFLTQYEQAGGDKPMIGGSITVDQTVLNYKGKRRESLLGTASAGPMADRIDTPEWKKFVADYKAAFKDGFPSPSLFAYLYYINTKAVLDGLDAVKGDLSGGQKAYRAALQKTNFKGPAGEVRIDDNRNGVGTTYITEVSKAADGSFYNKVVKTVPGISQTLGLSPEAFKKMGLGSRDVPDCRK
jgi:branched-chain amino acid transport system substrate-binding protein